jgi:hypothetical protein
MPLGRLGQVCEGRTVSSVFVAFHPEPPAGICRAAHLPINSQTTMSLFEVGDFCPKPQKGSFQQYTPHSEERLYITL